MRKLYPTLHSDETIKDELHYMGVDLFEPESTIEKIMAEAMNNFSSFVLEEEPDICKEILDNDSTDSVGLLQGGSDHFSIYRVIITGDEDPLNSCKPVTLILNEFYLHSLGRKYTNILTVERLREYMLSMCQLRSNSRDCGDFVSLGNLMFILQFGGPTDGQVRHIDNMVSNVQICLYMSSNCPSTIVYSMEGGDDCITDCKSLLEHWTAVDGYDVPSLIIDIFQSKCNEPLNSKSYTRYFSFWKTLNYNLECFGKLYQRVEYQLSLVVDPGSTLIAGGNEVHAGPPTSSSRMFAFAIGMPATADEEIEPDEHNIGAPVNDGEVQYSPVTLHIDLCCLLFNIINHEYNEDLKETDVKRAKVFLLRILVALLRDYPMKGYLSQIDSNRRELLEWLEELLDNLQNDTIVARSIEAACTIGEIFSIPEIGRKTKSRGKRRSKKRSAPNSR